MASLIDLDCSSQSQQKKKKIWRKVSFISTFDQFRTYNLAEKLCKTTATTVAKKCLPFFPYLFLRNVYINSKTSSKICTSKSAFKVWHLSAKNGRNRVKTQVKAPYTVCEHLSAFGWYFTGNTRHSVSYLNAIYKVYFPDSNIPWCQIWMNWVQFCP